MQSLRFAFVAFCVAASVALAPASLLADELVRPTRDPLGPHVRGITAMGQRLITEGVRRSFTFRDLVERLNKSDVIVYIEPTKKLPSGLDGRLTFLTSAGGVRYLHIQVTSTLAFEAIIAIAAHELQHALEVANHPEVRDAAGLGVLYERIGIPGPAKNRYDTTAAQDTGRRVRSELS